MYQVLHGPSAPLVFTFNYFQNLFTINFTDVVDSKLGTQLSRNEKEIIILSNVKKHILLYSYLSYAVIDVGKSVLQNFAN